MHQENMLRMIQEAIEMLSDRSEYERNLIVQVLRLPQDYQAAILFADQILQERDTYESNDAF